MPWLPIYFDAMNAARNGESAREAERRAMYARPDAPPLPEEPPRQGWVAAILGRVKVTKLAGPNAGMRWLRGT
jgi:hypothetical protein